MLNFLKKIFGNKNSLEESVKRNFDFSTFKNSSEENAKENLDIKISPIAVNIQFGKDTDIQVSELLKKATALKKTDIEQSILLIKQALKIDPDYPCYDKLYKYLIIADRMDEAEELTLKLIDECKGNNNLSNFSNRAGNYESYSAFQFKKGLYKEYIFYYCLSIYNAMVWDAINEQIKCVKVQLNAIKNKEEFTDKKTNKSFQAIGVSSNQDLFIKTFYEILKSYQFDELYKLVNHLNNKQKGIEALEIESFKKGKADWKLWSSKEFCDTISLFAEQIFIDKYKSKLEILLLKSQ